MTLPLRWDSKLCATPHFEFLDSLFFSISIVSGGTARGILLKTMTIRPAKGGFVSFFCLDQEMRSSGCTLVLGCYNFLGLWSANQYFVGIVWSANQYFVGIALYWVGSAANPSTRHGRKNGQVKRCCSFRRVSARTFLQLIPPGALTAQHQLLDQGTHPNFVFSLRWHRGSSNLYRG